MIAKQKNLRVFHISIEDKEKFVEYFKKNKLLLKEFFLLIDGKLDRDIENLLNESDVCFKDISCCKIRFLGAKKVDYEEVEKKDSSEQVNRDPIKEQKNKISIFERPIRSGEEINEELPVVVFGRVNSGAKLFSSQSVSIYGIIDGLVICEGEFLLLYGIGKRGNLIFNGEIIERELLKENVLQKISMISNKVVIKEV